MPVFSLNQKARTISTRRSEQKTPAELFQPAFEVLRPAEIADETFTLQDFKNVGPQLGGRAYNRRTAALLSIPDTGEHIAQRITQ